MYLKSMVVAGSLWMVGCGAATSGANAESSTAAKPDKLAGRVAHQASFDLNCGEKELTVSQISEDMGGQIKTYGARGCTRQATYKVSCSIFGCTVFNEAQARNLGSPN